MFKSGLFNRSGGTMGEPIEVEDSLELEYDMWDGQFDFVGPQDPAVRLRITSDNSVTEDLFTGGPLTPHLTNGVNGGKKTAAHQWCDNLSDQVRVNSRNSIIAEAWLINVVIITIDVPEMYLMIIDICLSLFWVINVITHKLR